MSYGCGKQLGRWAGPQHTVLARLLQLQVLLLVVDPRAALSIKLKLLPPSVPRWFYNGTYASPWCETTFRCDTSSRNGTLPLCSCHPNCSLYDACCEDVRPSDWRKRALPPDVYECAVYPSLGTDTNGNLTLRAAEFVFLITKCPSAYAGSCVALLCNLSSSDMRNDKLRLTWVTDQSTGVTYKNKFCAACHGLTSEKMVFWNHSYDCIDDPAFAKFGISGCKHNVLLLDAIEEKLLRCPSRSYYTSCQNGSLPQLQEACTNSPTRYFYDRENFVTYRNYNCSLCGFSSSISFSSCTRNILATCFLFINVVPVSGVRGCLYERVGCSAKEERMIVQKVCLANAFLTNRLPGKTAAMTSPPNAQRHRHFKSESGVSSGGTRLLHGALLVCLVLTRALAFCENGGRG